MPPVQTAFARDPDEIRIQDYSLSDEQDILRATFARFFDKSCDSATVRAAEPLGFDPELWRKTVELDVLSLRLPDERGGHGGSLVDLALVCEEVGRAAAPIPLAEACASASLLALANDPDSDDRLAAVLAGEVVTTLAPTPLDNNPHQLIPAGAVARNVIAFAGDQLILVERETPAPHVKNLGSAPLARLSQQVSDHRVILANGARARELYLRCVAEWQLLTAAALVGIAEQAINGAVEFAKTRLTSKVPIGALQGVSHPLAEAEVMVSASRNLIWKAAWFHDKEPRARPELTPMAFAHADWAATFATETALHVQGGFGFTLESDASLYFRRAKGWSMAGNPAAAVAAVGDALASAAGFAKEEERGGASELWSA
jgi:alkylation response protein AidB-like acyl-CoA dehydrogenase